MHRTREPLQRSTWWALGELTRCSSVPTVTYTLAEGRLMTPTWLDEAQQAVKRAQQLWHIPEQGPDYPWWGFKVPDRYTLKLRDEVVSLLEKAKKQLDRLAAAAEQYAAQIGATGSVAWMLRAGELLDASPRPPTAWLTATDLPQLSADLDQCAELYKQRGQSREPLTQRYGATLWALPPGTAASVEEAWHKAAPLLAPGDEKGAGLLTHQQQLRGWAADTQKRVSGWLTEARTIERWLNVSAPQGEAAAAPQDPSPYWLKRLLRLAHLVASENAPEKSWVLDAATLAQVKTLIGVNRPQFVKYHDNRAQLLKTYKEEFFELDLERIADGFAGPYQSWFRFLNLQFRRDRRAIARRSHAYQMPPTITADIFVARDLLREKARLEGEYAARQAVLGRYEKGLATDFDAAERAMRIGAEAAEVVQEMGQESLPEKFVGGGCQPPARRQKRSGPPSNA